MEGLLAAYLIYYIAVRSLEPLIRLLVYLVEIFCDWFCIFLKHAGELLFYLVEQIWQCLWSFLKLLGRTALTCCLSAGRGTRAMLVFFYYLVDEALHGGADQENHDDEEAEDELDEQQAQNNSYENALRLLGLQADCTLEMFNRAFRSAMVQAHPDKGGTHEDALALNAAREILKTHKGWRS